MGTPCLGAPLAPAEPPLLRRLPGTSQGAVAGIHMLQCFHAAGFPAGLLALATGRGAEIGDYLTMHPAVNCISFTGGDTGGRGCGDVTWRGVS